MNKRRRYLAKRRRAEWNRLHIRALTYWSTLPRLVAGENVVTLGELTAHQEQMRRDVVPY